MIFNGMDAYLRQKADGKLMHDPLAASAAIDEDVITWAEVDLF